MTKQQAEIQAIQRTLRLEKAQLQALEERSKEATISLERTQTALRLAPVEKRVELRKNIALWQNLIRALKRRIRAKTTKINLLKDKLNT